MSDRKPLYERALILREHHLRVVVAQNRVFERTTQDLRDLVDRHSFLTIGSVWNRFGNQLLGYIYTRIRDA